MQSHFLTSLITEDIGNDLNRLVQPLRFKSAKYGILEAPEGFVTNFMSVPRVPAFVFAWLGGRYKAAGAIHDYLYQFKILSRAASDYVLREAMDSLGASTTEINACWLAVRIGGWSRYGIK